MERSSFSSSFSSSSSLSSSSSSSSSSLAIPGVLRESLSVSNAPLTNNNSELQSSDTATRTTPSDSPNVSASLVRTDASSTSLDGINSSSDEKNNSSNAIPTTSTRTVTTEVSNTGMLGSALCIIFLLSNYDKYGLTERVSYHFHLTEALGNASQLSSASSMEVDNQQQQQQQQPAAAAAARWNSPASLTISSSSHRQPNPPGYSHPSLQQKNPRHVQSSVCGVVQVLECIPAKTPLSREERRNFKMALQRVNHHHQTIQPTERRNPVISTTPTLLCHEPQGHSFWKLNPTSRVFFSYQKTRIVLLIDASPTLTCTFGFLSSSSNNHPNFSLSSQTSSCCCPLDLITDMVQTYLLSLVEPIQLQKGSEFWKPDISITIMAVFPGQPWSSSFTTFTNSPLLEQQQQQQQPSTSFLVRAYDLVDRPSVHRLMQHFETWLYATVEEEISNRLGQKSASTLLGSNHLSSRKYCSYLREWLEAGDAALSTLASEAYPHLVVVTDGRSVICDSVVHNLTTSTTTTTMLLPDQVDRPLSILHIGMCDFSQSTTTRTTTTKTTAAGGYSSLPSKPPSLPTIAQIMLSDMGGPACPLHISNDMDALYDICLSTRGCFWDANLLKRASQTLVGKVKDDSHFSADPFFTYRRHTLHCNAVQWYTLFSLSPLTPPLNSTSGKLPLPYCMPNEAFSSIQPTTVDLSKTVTSASVSKQPPGLLTSSNASSMTSSGWVRGCAMRYRKQNLSSKNRTIFSIYVINPIRIQSLLQIRIREGYRALRYGAHSDKSDRLDLLFVLPLDLDICLHYELSYKAMSNHNHMVGSTQIKLYLSGETNLIQTIKQDFVRTSSNSSSTNNKEGRLTLAQQFSARLCRMLRRIRKEDMLLSYIAPVRWNDQLLTKDSPFVKRLGALTKQQRLRHFRVEQFDCVCTGNMPYNAPTQAFLTPFHDVDNGEKGLLEAISGWSTIPILPYDLEGNQSLGLFLKKLKFASSSSASYCLIEILRCQASSRIFTVSVETFSGATGVSERLEWISFLRNKLASLKDVRVLEKQIAPYLVAFRRQQQRQQQQQKIPLQSNTLDRVMDNHIKNRYRAFLENQTNHFSWDLMDVMDDERLPDELLPLLMRRRVEIDGFYLLEYDADYALLARIEPGEDIDDPGDLIQYQIMKSRDRVIVHLHMESERGVIFPLGTQGGPTPSDTTFGRLSSILEKTDKECGRALRARTNLLACLSSSKVAEEPKDPVVEKHYSTSLRIILPYTSRTSLRLRYFHEWSSSANDILKSLIQGFLLSRTESPQIARIPVGSLLSDDEILPGFDAPSPGDWFVVKYDAETMSLLHMAEKTQSQVSITDGRSTCYREMDFCTISISDLYMSRQGHNAAYVEEYMSVTELSELITSAHADLYSLAAYMALRKDNSHLVDIHADDFSEVLERLDWIEVSKVVVERGSKKIIDLVGTLLHQVSEHSFYFYFASSEPEDLFELSDEDSSEFSQALKEQDESESSSLESADEMASRKDDDESSKSDSTVVHINNQPTVPLFFLFLLDGKPASAFELSRISRSYTISAMVSTYRSKRRQSKKSLPTSHRSAAARLSQLLNAYVAEQTLERLRIHGSDIHEADLQLAKVYLRRARDIVITKVHLYFYVAEIDNMVPAGRGGAAVAEEDRLFENELKSNKSLKLKSDGTGNFVVVGTTEIFPGEIPYWCFIALSRSQGIVTVKVQHPSGYFEAERIACLVGDEINRTCHRVNQLLLLRHMHRSRAASKLIVAREESEGHPPITDSNETEIEDSNQAVIEEFTPGFFVCPIQFRFMFDVFHRGNPLQVARTLESTVLHMFALTNRRHIFVYKDEDGSIFYMNLQPVEVADLDSPEGKLELLVRGIDMPGVSVTTQLTKLLAKRLMLIGVDMLSVVLTKNPRYSWKFADISFVRSFRERWMDVDDSELFYRSQKSERVYCFPASVYDLGTVLMLFRQNLCGSTFFHPLVVGHFKSVEEVKKALTMMFFFNNSPSKLNASLQAQTTLTVRGDEYRRLAGTGIAIIEVSLFSKDSNDAHHFKMGREIPDNWIAGSIPNAVDENESTTSTELSDWRLLVKIEDTALQTDALHSWVKLTLNQALAGWTIERHLEWQHSLSSSKPLIDVSDTSIEKLAPGLPKLVSLIKETCSIAHPGAKVCESRGVMRSSDIASIALSLFEGPILEPLNELLKPPQKLLLDKHLVVIRLSRGRMPSKVKLDWNNERRKALIRVVGTVDSGPSSPRVLQDEPIESPEYLFSCFLPEWDREEEIKSQTSPKLFRTVHVEKHRLLGTDEEKRAFRRSFAFVFSVQRNRRILYAYNWDHTLYDTVSRRLLEEDGAFLNSWRSGSERLQRRALGILSPLSGTFSGREQLPSLGGKKTSSEGQNDATIEDSKSSRRQRPIKQPKLIGKSVEGAAAQALAASRARASFKGIQGTPNRPSGARTSGARPPAKGQVQRSGKKQLSNEDAQIVQVQKEVFAILTSAPRMIRMTRRHSLLRSSFFSLLKPLCPLEASHVTRRGADFLLQGCCIAWDVAFKILPLPLSTLEGLISTIGSTLAGRSDLDVIPASRGEPGVNLSSFLLVGPLKNLRYAKCCTVVRLVNDSNFDGSHSLRCQGFNLFLPRRSEKHTHLSFHRCISERDAAGSDKLATSTVMHTNVESLLFDYMASTAGNLTKPSSHLMEGIGIGLLNALLKAYQLTDQLRMTDSHLKVYQVRLVLSSYRNEIIDLFDAKSLFGWLQEHQKKRGMVPLGPFALVCQRDIVVRGSHSAIVLTFSPEDSTSLGLVILCRTNGRDLRELMFRGQSNVAVSVATAIAIEGVSILHEELVAAATSLHRENLWERASKGSGSDCPSNQELLKLIELCSCTPILPEAGNSRLNLLFESLNEDCFHSFESMLQDRAFQPSYTLPGEDHAADQWIFYVSSEDLFLLARTHRDIIQRISFYILCQDLSSLSETSSSLLIRRLANFILHDVWKRVLTD